MKTIQVNNPHLFKIPKVKIVKGRIDFVLEKCKGKKVLHLGCVDEGLTIERFKKGQLMHLKLMKVAKEVCGVDISKEGIKFLQEEGINNIIYGDVEHLDSIKKLQEEKYDIILAFEIIEHLNNPGLFLQSTKKLFSSNTKMIITVPNAFRITGRMDYIKGYEFVHPDHNYWFSWKTLSTLLSYIIDEIYTYSFVDHEKSILKGVIKKIFSRNKKNSQTNICQESTSKKNVFRITDRIKTITAILIRRYLYKKNPFFADGIIAIVKPGELNKNE